MRVYLLIVALMCIGSIVIAQKPSKKDLLQKQKQISAKASSVRKQLRTMRRSSAQVMKDIRRTDELLENVRERLNITIKKLKQARINQAKAQKELDIATKRLDDKKHLVAKRLRAIYLRGEPKPILVLLRSESFSEISERSYILNRIASMDKKMITDLDNARKEIEKRKHEIDETVEEINCLRRKQAMEQAELNRHMLRKRTYLQELREQAQLLEHQLDELEKESLRIEAALVRYYSMGGGRIIWRGKWMQPVTGRIVSGFGMRKHPIFGGTRMHTGVDIPARTGTPIRAAGSGIVIGASYMGGYGNTVILDHGAGVATLYAHCSKIYVRPGQRVQRGDTIAAVGSTGYSTGPHLHWEIRINGKPTNPLR